MIKKIRIDIRLTEKENYELELLKENISKNRTDTICKAIRFCLHKRKEFEKYAR